MDEHSVLRQLAEMMFTKYKCLQCGIHVYKCDACEDKFFVRMRHFCYFERSLLLDDLFPPDEGFEEECQEFGVDCSCMLPCAHAHLVRVKD